MTLVRFQPAPFKSLLSDFWNVPTDNTLKTTPLVNILETKEGFRLEVAAPGLAKEDFAVKVEKNILTVSGQKESKQVEDGIKIHRREFTYQAFERSFRLPESIDTDRVEAAFNQGVLQVNLVKKAELQPVTKTIAIN